MCHPTLRALYRTRNLIVALGGITVCHVLSHLNNLHRLDVFIHLFFCVTMNSSLVFGSLQLRSYEYNCIDSLVIHLLL